MAFQYPQYNPYSYQYNQANAAYPTAYNQYNQIIPVGHPQVFEMPSEEPMILQGRPYTQGLSNSQRILDDLAYERGQASDPFRNDYYDPREDRDAIIRERRRLVKRRLETALYRGGYALNGKNVYSPAYPY